MNNLPEMMASLRGADVMFSGTRHRAYATMPGYSAFGHSSGMCWVLAISLQLFQVREVFSAISRASSGVLATRSRLRFPGLINPSSTA